MVGKVTYNGAYSPNFGKSIGRGWIGIEFANVGEEFEIEHENKRTKIKVAPKKWYDPEDKRIKG